jgi:hypothetical protein
MFASTLTAALINGQRASVGPTDLGLLASPQQTTRSHSSGTSVTVRPAGPNDAECYKLMSVSFPRVPDTIAS